MMAGQEGATVTPSVRALTGRLQRAVAHVLLGTRPWSDRLVETIAAGSRGLRVLEIGSGRQDLGHDAYSLKALFDSSNEFVQSDVNPEFGHPVVDVTDMHVQDEFDLILCLYVLEHVFDVPTAVRNMHRALVPGGRLVIAVPHLYPYHDEPIDFWRFTEHSLRMLLAPHSRVQIRHAGPRRLPKALFAIATK